MRLVDLSMPIWEGGGYGEVLPMPNTPVSFTEYMTYDWHGMRRTRMKFDDESGSPFMTIWQRAPHISAPIEDGGIYQWHLDEVPLDRIIMRPTTILDVPATGDYAITGEDIDRAVENADYQEGDEVLLRTGWGTRERAYEMGADYVLEGPGWSYESCMRVGEIMRERHSAILMTDAPLIMTAAYQGWGWSTGPERIVPRPKPWPSTEARERFLDLPKVDPTKTAAPAGRPASLGKGGYRDLIKSTIAICKCLVEANQIQSKRVDMIMMPMLVKRGGASPCRFIAVEKD
jgi:kynurenine formamidase